MTESYKLSKFGRIGISKDKWIVDKTVHELPEHEKGYHPAKGIGKKFCSFYKGVCHVRFNRKTFPKKGKTVLNDCFVEAKYDYWLIWDLKTRALFGRSKNIEVDTIVYQKKFKEIKCQLV